MSLKILAAMSGGVDSSVAALLLLGGGHEVTGVTLRLFDACAGRGRTCCGLEDAGDARAVAARLGIGHVILEHQEAFRRLVISPFARAYAEGKTPNPCVLCNERVKFGTLWEYARSHGFDGLASGHHARIVRGEDGMELRRGRDPAKDQSYFLFSMDPALLARTRFPVGELTKGEVRRIARSAGLTVADKRESQDVCFADSRSYARVVEESAGPLPPGIIRHADGRILGRHGGVHRYTVGQRRGLRVPGGEPLYVLAIDPGSREITVGPKGLLEVRRFSANGWTWLGVPPDGDLEALVQVRYRQEARPARLAREEGGMVIEWLAEPRSVTPGQAAVAYRGDAVLGGGWIRKPLP